MRTFVCVVFALASFFAAVSEAASLPEFIPCSFHVEMRTRVMNPDREIVATSVDHVYYDHDNLWRWDSDFSGVAPVLDPQQWIIIWRPDMGVCYHDYGDRCLLNNGASTMTPLPYDWIQRGTGGLDWFLLQGEWEGMPVDIWHSTFVVLKYDVTFEANVYVLKEDKSVVLVKGSGYNSKLNLTYTMDAVTFEHNVPLDPTVFIPSARCTNGTVIKTPDGASADFKKTCYAGAAAFGPALWATLLLLLVAMLV